MEFLGSTAMATYMTGPRLGGSGTPTFLPSITVAEPGCKPYDTYPAPTPMRRSLTTLLWRPSSYYSHSRVDPCVPSTSSMPEPASERNRFSDLDTIKVPPVFAAARNNLYTRYSPNDWIASNLSLYRASNRVRCGSERIRGDSIRLCAETVEKTKRTAEDVGKKFGQRIDNIKYWRDEIQGEMDKMVSEIDADHRAKCCLERALAETQNTIDISQECLYARESRQGIDMIHDEVENQLIQRNCSSLIILQQEVDNVKRVQEEMRRKILEIAAQIALNRACLHELDKDSSDKFTALNLDSLAKQYDCGSRDIHYHDGIERIDNTNSVVETWARFSNNNIQKSIAERNVSVKLRDTIEDLLNKSANLMTHYWNAVNVSLHDRIKCHTEAKHQIQIHLAKVLQEIFDIEKIIELLKKSVQEKECGMKVAQTRLETRTRRPNMELCRDPVQHRLVEQVYEITETVEQLKVKLRESENALQHLLRTKSALEHDLSVKNHTLFIDRERVMGMRKTYPMSPKVACY